MHARRYSPEEGETRGLFVADAETYRVDRLWVVLQPVPMALDEESSSPALSEGDD